MIDGLDRNLSPIGAEMVAGLSAFCDALESGLGIKYLDSVRTVSLDPPAENVTVEDLESLTGEGQADTKT